MHLIDVENFYHKIYFESNKEFEDIRNLCLAEDNWLRKNYTNENLKIEECNGYTVIFEKQTDQPFGMAGLYNNNKYPSHIGKHLHRGYTFPKFRTKSYAELVSGLTLYHRHCIEPLAKLNPQFTSSFVSMQTRYKKSTKGYWEVLAQAFRDVDSNWKEGNGFILTCDWEVQKCYQNFVFRGDMLGCKIIQYEDWEKLIQGD